MRTPSRVRVAVLVVLASVSSPLVAGADLTCHDDSDCPWSACQNGACAQPLGLSHVAEVQLDPGALTPIVTAAALNLRDGAQTNLCSVPEFDCPATLAPDLAGQECTLDRVDFPGPVSLRLAPQAVQFTGGICGDVNGCAFDYEPVQAVVPFDVHITRSECLNDPDAGCAVSQDDVSASLSAVFDLKPQVANGNLQLCEHFSAVLYHTLDVTQMLHLPAVPDECLPLNQVTALAEQIMAPIEDVQVSASPDLHRLAVRVWFQTPASEIDLVGPSVDTYQAFFGGELAPAPAGTTWSVFIGQELLLRLARENAVNQIVLAAGASQPVFPDSEGHPGGFDASWLVPPAVPNPSAALTIYLRTDFGNCTVHFSVSANTQFSLDAAQQKFVITGGLDYDDSISGCLVGLIPGSGALLKAYLNGQIPSGTIFALDNLCSVDLDDRTFECDLPTVSPFTQLFPGSPMAQVAITDLLGDPAGLAAGGTISFILEPFDTPTTASIDGFFFGWDGSCSDQRLGWLGDLDVSGRGRVCSVEVLDDPQLEYGIVDTDGAADMLPQHYALEDRWGASATYPFHVLVRTTNGSGILSLPVPPPASLGQTLAAYTDMISQCYARQAGWLGIPGKYDPHWSVDPLVDLAGLLIVDQGTAVRAIVQLDHVQFEAIGPVQKATPGRGGRIAFFQTLRMSAGASVDAGRFGRFVVPIQIDLVAELDVQYQRGAVQLVGLEPASGGARYVQLPASALPSGYRGLSFTVPLGTRRG